MTTVVKLCLTVMMAFWGFAAFAQQSTSSFVELEQVGRRVYDAAGLPPESASWQTATLPFVSTDLSVDQWQQATATGHLWLRFVLSRPSTEANLSILFWRYNLALAVYFNGTEIAANGQRPGRITTAWNRPLLANISDNQWRTDNNEILVKLQVTEWGGNLAPPILGAKDALQDIQERREFQQVDLNQILLAFAATMAAFTLGLWFIRRHDTIYLWFSGICCTWAIGTLHTVIYYNPIPYGLWLPIVHIAIDCCIFFIYGFIGRLAGTRKSGLEKLFLAWTVVACLVHLLVPATLFWYSAYALHLVGVTMLLSMIIRVILLALREHKTEAIIISAAISTQIVLFLANASQMFFNQNDGWDGTLVYSHLGIPVLLLIFAAVLLRRFTQALTVSETLNRELEQKIEVSRQIIARSFEERRKLEMRQAAEMERQKIYRDLHDDVGSRLLSIIHANHDGKVGELARSTLESLRQAVSRANTPDQSLVDLIADIREESELRLAGSGHHVHWEPHDGPPDCIIPSAIAYNLNRIMKELISNIIRHANADTVHITIDFRDDRLVMTVSDNGTGIKDRHSHGNGLKNLRTRAAEMGADIEWFSSSQGLRTRLLLTDISLLMGKSMPESPVP